MPNPFYASAVWAKTRAKVRSRWLRAGLPCHYCGQPFAKGEKMISVDHILPLVTHPHLALNMSNLVCVHHACNTRKAKWSDNSTKERINEEGYPASWA